ncbi:uncharacterized protein [Onthophagus taurus]|uniref:uncharacterized protein n=1 Tax=Onthophagus taurus TaxID=166361 RepID=UPI0039BE7021
MNISYVFFLMTLVLLPPIFPCVFDSDEKDESFKIKRAGKGKKFDKRNRMEKRNRMDDQKFFEGISEITPSPPHSTATRPDFFLKHRHSKQDSLKEIKTLLSKLLDKIDEIEMEEKVDSFKKKLKASESYLEDYPENKITNNYPLHKFSEQTSMPSLTPKLSLIQKIERRRRKKERKDGKRQRWGKWTNWSPCSVSCGKGREIRWRHCLENCDIAETEMEEKTCQLPACGPSKLFGVIKL